jgi:hypothetical protein
LGIDIYNCPRERRLNGGNGSRQRCTQPAEKVIWPRGLVDKHGILSKPGPILKFKRCLNLSDTGGFILPLAALAKISVGGSFRFYGFQVKV